MKLDVSGCSCPVEYVLDMIGGKWKVWIIWELRDTRRFNELERRIPGVTRKVLIRQLRELERDQLITRTIFAQVPPKVEYSLTESGRKLLDVFATLTTWADEHLDFIRPKV